MLVAAGMKVIRAMGRQKCDTDSGGGWIGFGICWQSRNSSGDSDDELGSVIRRVYLFVNMIFSENRFPLFRIGLLR